ncbi:hypothetical protein BREVUG8_110899 [Brevundimonas sp. G8]|nr:hypothetical protein BREVUG8_110899 [Brevundimonas sp. G8]
MLQLALLALGQVVEGVLHDGSISAREGRYGSAWTRSNGLVATNKSGRVSDRKCENMTVGHGRRLWRRALGQGGGNPVGRRHSTLGSPARNPPSCQAAISG